MQYNQSNMSARSKWAGTLICVEGISQIETLQGISLFYKFISLSENVFRIDADRRREKPTERTSHRI